MLHQPAGVPTGPSEPASGQARREGERHKVRKPAQLGRGDVPVIQPGHEAPSPSLRVTGELTSAFDLKVVPKVTLAEITRILSTQEQRVLCKFIECPNDKKVAHQMGKRLQTVRNQLASVQRKLGVGSRCELMVVVLSAWFSNRG